MKRAHGAIEILEQAVGLLRSAPAAAVLAYLTGTIPFTVGLLFFLVDMTHSPFAFEHLGEASLAMALLYVWKCSWQAVFCARLHGQLGPAPERAGSVWRAALIQTAFQPLGLMFAFPLPWLIAFFRNLALFAGLGVLHPVRTAGRQAALWPRQNTVILLVVSLASLLLFANVLALLIFLPQLGRSFLGIEGDLARLGAVGLLNWTTVSIATAICWLAIDPLLDAVYILRCFYGESVTTGEDLRAALRKATIAAGLILACLTIQPSARAQDAPQEQRTTSVDAAQLDSSIQEVIHRREFTWRVPLAHSEKDDGRIVSWFRSFWDTVGNVWDWIAKKLDDWFGNRQGSESDGKGAAVTRRQLEVLIAIVVALIAAGAIFFFRGKRRPVVVAQAIQGATPAIDLTDESLTADQLPEDSWWKLADDLRAKGDLRLAMRALYLAGINHLAGRGLVSVRRWKTGLEYRRELDRRARATPGLPPVFANGVALFELGWYGHRPVDQPLVEALMASIRELRSHGQPK